ncbi:hypothetical protein BASA82_001108, partial [Batrachochytrium salamandrivorans]
MSFESYRTTDSIARQRSATSTSRDQHDANLTKLFKKDVPLFGVRTGKVFTGSEDCFAKSDFLLIHDSRPFILETDASDYAISGVLSPYDDSSTLRPDCFFMRANEQRRANYEIYDKELLAVVESFKHWRHFLQGGLHPVTVFVTTRTWSIYDDQEVNSSSGSLVSWNCLVRLHLLIDPVNLMVGPIHFPREVQVKYESSTSAILDPSKVL